MLTRDVGAGGADCAIGLGIGTASSVLQWALGGTASEARRSFAGQAGEPPLAPIRFDIRKILAVHTRRALVGATLGIGMRQNIIAADLVVQGVEAITGFCLRFRVNRPDFSGDIRV